MPSERLKFPATSRNRDPILEVLHPLLAPGCRVLELASGSGEHAVYFAARLAEIRWVASDVDPQARASIGAWASHIGAANVEVITADAAHPPWPVSGSIDAVVNINMIHIAPWEACEGLMRGAGELLGPGGVLYMYGPYKRDGSHTAPSNEAFDESLRARDPRWGVRDLDRVVTLAESHGLTLEAVVAMPANNYSVIYRRG